MTFAEKNRIFLAKLQNLPDKKKKIILWTVVAVLGLAMGIFWVRGAINNLSKINGEMQSVKIPQMNIPNIPTPNLENTNNQNLTPNK
jgi:hypothetical protein